MPNRVALPDLAMALIRSVKKGPALAVALALVPAALGITWGLPSSDRFARVAGGHRSELAREIIERTRVDAA